MQVSDHPGIGKAAQIRDATNRIDVDILILLHGMLVIDMIPRGDEEVWVCRDTPLCKSKKQS
jgi:hypothetical protein